MIEQLPIYEHIRSVMLNSFNDSSVRVIKLKSNTTRPKEVYATLDILNITDSAGYTTNTWFDSATNEFVYETYKDVLLSISVRNGDYRNEDDQTMVGVMASELHKSFTYDNVLDYIDKELNASVISTTSCRSIPDYVPTGINEAFMFNVVLGMIDITRVGTNSIIEHIESDGLLDDEHIYPDDTIDNPPSCSGLTIIDSPDILSVQRSINNIMVSGKDFGILEVAPFTIAPNTYFKIANRNIGDGSYRLLWDDDQYVYFKSDLTTQSVSITVNDVEVYVGGLFNGDIEYCFTGSELILVINQQVITVPFVTTQLFTEMAVDFTKNFSGYFALVFNHSDFISPSIPNVVDICGDKIEG